MAILTGKINASAVQAKAPVKLINRPNLGIIVALTPTLITTAVRNIMFLIYGVFVNGLGESWKHFVFSVMSIAGMA